MTLVCGMMNSYTIIFIIKFSALSISFQVTKKNRNPFSIGIFKRKHKSFSIRSIDQYIRNFSMKIIIEKMTNNNRLYNIWHSPAYIFYFLHNFCNWSICHLPCRHIMNMINKKFYFSINLWIVVNGNGGGRKVTEKK